MRISDWSSDVCSSDLADIIVANQDLVLADLTMPGEDDSWGGVILPRPDETLYIFDEGHHVPGKAIERGAAEVFMTATVRQLSRLGRQEIGRASCRERGCRSV